VEPIANIQPSNVKRETRAVVQVLGLAGVTVSDAAHQRPGRLVVKNILH
jgi:hypothetical protein